MIINVHYPTKRSERVTPLIRTMEPGERAGRDRLWATYLAFYGSARQPEMFDLAFARLLSEAPNTNCGFIASVDGRARGLAHNVFHAHGRPVQAICYLQDPYVDPEVRGLGVGRALVVSMSDAAREAGVGPVSWLTQEDNAEARLLYDRIAEKSPLLQNVRV